MITRPTQQFSRFRDKVLGSLIGFSTAIYFNVYDLHLYVEIVELGLKCMLLIILGFEALSAKPRRASRIELLLACFWIYLFFRTILATHPFLLCFDLVFAAICFIGLQAIVADGLQRIVRILLYAAVSSQIFIFSICAYHIFDLSQFIQSRYTLNASVFGIVLSVNFSILTSSLSRRLRKERKLSAASIAAIVISVVTLTLIYFSHSRTAWLTILLLAFIELYSFLRTTQAKKVFRKVFPICLLVALSLLLLFKKDSSLGRMLIARISFQLFTDHAIFGVGPDGFRQSFGVYQAEYFSTRDINSQNAMLADNTIYAFNEWLQLGAEVGIVGLCLVIAIIVDLVRELKKVYSDRSDELKVILFPTVCLLVASFVFYPFHVFPLILFGLACLSGVTASTFRKPVAQNSLHLVKWPVVAALVIALNSYVLVVWYRWQENKAEHARQIGLKMAAADIYNRITILPFLDGKTYSSYADLLYQMGRFDAALECALEAKQHHANADIYTLLAKIYDETGHYSEAESAYLEAVYMVPHKMRTRMDLLEFYVRRNDRRQVVFWATSISQMLIKVKSKKATQMKNKAGQLLSDWKTY